MGDVYRARDTRLDRLVALRISTLNSANGSTREARGSPPHAGRRHRCHMIRSASEFEIPIIGLNEASTTDPGIAVYLDQFVGESSGAAGHNRLTRVHSPDSK